MNGKNARQKLLGIIICICAAFSAGCSTDAKDARADVISDDSRRVGAEEFMPEQVRNVFNRSCVSCHAHDGRGIAAVAPGLQRAKHRSAEEWDKYLRNSGNAHPAGHPPPLWLDGDEMKTMATYLDALTQKNQ